MLNFLTKIVAYLQELFHETFNINIRGLGFLYRQFDKDQYFKVKGAELFFNHKIADNYGRLINGRFNEPETHKFIDKAIAVAGSNVRFVEVGGNIGEFVLDYAINSKVDKIVVFEPQLEQSKSIEKTIEKNNFNQVRLIKKLVSSVVEELFFNVPENNTYTAGINYNATSGIKMISTTLDIELEKSEQPHIFLIDVEGAEFQVMKGGQQFITANRPLIIFEYHLTTQTSFHVSDIQAFLGQEYKIYRLNREGNLDNELENAWNLVAIHTQSVFKNLA